MGVAVIGEIPRLGAVFPEGESAAPYLSRRLPRSLRGRKCEKPGASRRAPAGVASEGLGLTSDARFAAHVHHHSLGLFHAFEAHDALADGVADEVRAVAGVELGHDVRLVRLHRLH